MKQGTLIFDETADRYDIRFKKYALKHIYQSASYEKVHVNPQKKLVYILQMSVKALLLHPLSGTKAAMF